MRVLIIDDERDICYLLSALLKQKNLVPAYVNTLSDARTALIDTDPEVVFLDNHLPDGLGMDFISYIKSNFPNIKIIMITAHDTETDRARAKQEGADFFIGKPFNREIIYKTVDSIEEA